MTQTAERTVPYEVYEREHALRLKAEQERDRWKQEFYLQREIRRAPILQPITKAVLEECRHVERWGTVKAPDGSTRANFTTIAKNLHTSPDTVARHAERLEKLDLIEIHEHQGPQDERDRKYIHVKEEKLPVLARLEDPEQVIPKQGGNRYICPECDSPNVVIRKVRTLHCLACNHEGIIEDTGWIMQNGHKLQKQLAFEEKSPETASDPQKQLAEHSIPSTPPAVEPIRDPQELEQAAAQVLIAIAGDAPAHIEMSRTSSSTKYFTVHTPLADQDLLAHLRGETTKGIINRPLDGMTRAICFDGDTPADWQGLQDAAQLLVAADDFKPILEPSPARGEHAGGGHLWVIYDDLVDAYSALQTLYQYVPALRQYKEHWPGGGINMRLPGGTYVRPGFEATCHLFDENMQNGIGTAAMLVERQTPASVVREYPRPAPEPEPQRTQRGQGQGGYLDKDLARQYIADFNAARDWSDIAALAGGFVHGKFPAIWRGERVPSVGVNPRTDLAKDFGAPGEPAMDKFDVWCHIEAHYSGMDWQEFKRRELTERCTYRREQERRAS